MNYLAHLLLAEPHEDSQLGGLIGDFMSGRQLDEFAPGVQRGILRHRRIDELTDAHPVFRRSRQRLEPGLRRFSGVVADIVYDHFLATSWEQWHEAPIEDFTAPVYTMLEARREELPPRLLTALPWIVGEDWLSRYGELDHMRRVFAGLARRVKRTNPLAAAYQLFTDHYEDLAADFAEFFPELRESLAE